MTAPVIHSLTLRDIAIIAAHREPAADGLTVRDCHAVLRLLERRHVDELVDFTDENEAIDELDAFVETLKGWAK